MARYGLREVEGADRAAASEQVARGGPGGRPSSEQRHLLGAHDGLPLRIVLSAALLASTRLWFRACESTTWAVASNALRTKRCRSRLSGVASGWV